MLPLARQRRMAIVIRNSVEPRIRRTALNATGGTSASADLMML
jgi:hypothetical protein